MRFIAFLVAAFAVSAPAAAQTWQEYNYPEFGFSVSFPIAPQIERTTYPVADGRSVPARIYSVRQNNALFEVTVADLANSGLAEKTIIEHAVKLAAQGGEVKVDFPHRISQVYGRQLSVLGADGSRSTMAVFDTNGRLYQIEAKIPPGGNDTDLIRFQQSLIFAPSLANRSEDAVRGIREACHGLVNNPAGLYDPRCVRK